MHVTSIFCLFQKMFLIKKYFIEIRRDDMYKIFEKNFYDVINNFFSSKRTCFDKTFLRKVFFRQHIYLYILILKQNSRFSKFKLSTHWKYFRILDYNFFEYRINTIRNYLNNRIKKKCIILYKVLIPGKNQAFHIDIYNLIKEIN